MQLRITVTRRRVAIFTLAVTAVALSGVAYAAIPDAAGVIHGCRANTGGSLRVIDSEAGATCRASETALDWNQTGPQGPAGPAGPAGPQGPAGTAKAWARIDATGTIQSSSGFGSATVSHPRTGVYCIHNLPFQPRVAVGSATGGLRSDPTDPTLVAPNFEDVNLVTGVLDLSVPDVFLAFCDTGTPATASVRIYTANVNGLFDRGFSIFLDG